MEQLEDFFCFRDRTTKEEYQLTDEGAIVTEKIAKELKVGIGDTITLKDDEGGEAEVTGHGDLRKLSEPLYLSDSGML